MSRFALAAPPALAVPAPWPHLAAIVGIYVCTDFAGQPWGRGERGLHAGRREGANAKHRTGVAPLALAGRTPRYLRPHRYATKEPRLSVLRTLYLVFLHGIHYSRSNKQSFFSRVLQLSRGLAACTRVATSGVGRRGPARRRTRFNSLSSTCGTATISCAPPAPPTPGDSLLSVPQGPISRSANGAQNEKRQALLVGRLRSWRSSGFACLLNGT